MEEQGLPLHPLKHKGGGAGQPLAPAAGDLGIGQLGEPFQQLVPQTGQPGGFLGQVVHRLLEGGGQTHGPGHVLGAGAAALLLPAALDQGGQPQRLFHIQGPYPLGSAELVAGQGEQVHVPRLHIHRDVAHRLDGVGVEEHLVGLGDGADLSNGLNGADLIVGGHDRDEDGVGADGRLHGGGVHPALPVHRQVGHLIALLLHPLGGVENGVVLDGGGDDVAGLFTLEGHQLGHPTQGPVVRLGAAGGKINLLRLGVQTAGHRGPGLLQVALGLLAEGVQAGGVAVALGEVGQHGLQSLGGDGGGPGVVGVDHLMFHGENSFLFT